MELKELKKIIEDNGYRMEQSISGYWRLWKGEELVYDDSASDDVYEEYSAAALFVYQITNEE